MPRGIPPSEKIFAVKKYLNGKGSKGSIAAEYKVTRSTFQQWIGKYQAFGEAAFLRTGHNATYSVEFKQMVINAYLSGEGSPEYLAVKYKIPSIGTIRGWVQEYNNYENQKTSKKEHRIVTKARKTTFEERIEIVQYCIANEHNYIKTAKKYDIPYQRVRTYTLKYEEAGLDGLQDHRGRKKPKVDSIDESERLRAENKLLREENGRT